MVDRDLDFGYTGNVNRTLLDIFGLIRPQAAAPLPPGNVRFTSGKGAFHIRVRYV